jgi:class 3 adenylate cyclase/tetratricopeptide (TPR) repeat protein
MSSLDDKLDQLQRYLPSYLAHKILATRGRLEGERKVVTVLFADIAGYTGMSERLGEEALFALMDDVYELLIHEVHRYEGTVNELTGDGILAFFGAPLAVENAPQRAVRAGLSIQRAIARFSSKLEQEKGQSLKVRVGINTGPVIVGTVGNNLRMDYKAVGDTVNLAARMQQTAEPGTIQVTENTYRLVEGYFRCDDLGFVDVKGRAAKVHAYRVTAERGARGRIDIQAERGLTPFVGRERELELLRDCFDRAKAGRGQAFSIVGEAGLGKSRLLYELRQSLAGERFTFLEGRCVPYGASVAYLPIIDLLRNNFRLEPSDSGEQITQKVRTGLQRLRADLEVTLSYLLYLLGVEPDGGIPNDTPPEVLKTKTFDALRLITLKGADIQPVVMAIEDLHWMDKTSEQFASFLIDQISGARVLLIFTYRLEFVPKWSGKSYHNLVNLARLSNRESHRMLTALLQGAQVDDRLTELVLEKSDGVPFFIEELVKSLVETSTIELHDSQWTLKAAAGELQVPNTVEELLTARIDRLPEGAKRILQIGAVIGREFSWDLLRAVAAIPEMELISHLSALKDAELIYERGIHPQTTHVFKHAFTQEVAYESLLLSTRRGLHQKIGDAILTRHGTASEEWSGLLSHHFSRSGDTHQALRYLMQAGQRALRVYANAEALRSFSQALDVLDSLPSTEDTRAQQVELALQLASLHDLLGHYGESLPFFARALDLAQAAGDERAVARLETRIGRVRYTMGDNEGAIACFQRALDLGNRLQDKVRMAVSYQSLGDVYFTSGRLLPAIDCYMRALRHIGGGERPAGRRGCLYFFEQRPQTGRKHRGRREVGSSGPPSR